MFELISEFNQFNQWIIIGTISFITLFILYVKRAQTYWERQSIPGPKPKFLTGNVSFLKPVHDSLLENYRKYGKIHGTYNGVNPILNIADPELIRQICVKDFHIFPHGFEFVYLHPVERHFLTTVSGPKWKRLRTTLTPTFTSSKIKKMFELFKICNSDAQKQLTKLASSDEPDFDPKYFWGRYNLDVITKCFFATSFDIYNNSDDEVLQHFVDLFKPSPFKIFFIFSMPKWMPKMFKISASSPTNLDFIKNMILPIIENRKKGSVKGNDFLQLLIDAEVTNENEMTKKEDKRLDNDEIIGSSVIFLLAGYETTSTLLTWACYRLATNLDVQEKLYHEVSNANIEDYEVLQSLPYLDAVISETLRMDPPISVVQRIPQSDYVLPGTKVVVKKGTVCTIPTYAIHHDPDNYPEPDLFKPERFIDDSPKPFTFLPFGAGPRVCIGMRFALTSAKLSLASIVRNYHIFTTKKTQTNPEVMPGIFFNITKNLSLGIKSR